MKGWGSTNPHYELYQIGNFKPNLKNNLKNKKGLFLSPKSKTGFHKSLIALPPILLRVLRTASKPTV